MSSKTAVVLGFLAFFMPVFISHAAEITVVNPLSRYPEGPVLAGKVVYYAEMGADRVMAWDGRKNRRIWSMRGCGPTSVARGAEGNLLVLCHRQGSVVRISAAGATLSVLAQDGDGLPFPTPNASVNDAHGGVYFSLSGEFSPYAEVRGAVVYLDGNGVARQVVTGIHYANGVALSADGKVLFVSEHLSRRVLAYDVLAPGRLSAGRVFLVLDDVLPADPDRPWEAGPDGLATDSAGNLYVAEYGGGRLFIVDRNATLLADIPFPERYTTAPLLMDDERRILVTAPASFMNDQAPGKVYLLDNPVWPGQPDRP